MDIFKAVSFFYVTIYKGKNQFEDRKKRINIISKKHVVESITLDGVKVIIQEAKDLHNSL